MANSMQNWDFNQFYCVCCGRRGIDIVRARRKREAGHLKKIFCLNCQKETNHVEIKGKYTYEDFLDEFENHNFSIDGQRKLPFPQFNAYMNERKPVVLELKLENGAIQPFDAYQWKDKYYDTNLDLVEEV